MAHERAVNILSVADRHDPGLEAHGCSRRQGEQSVSSPNEQADDQRSLDCANGIKPPGLRIELLAGTCEKLYSAYAHFRFDEFLE